MFEFDGVDDYVEVPECLVAITFGYITHDGYCPICNAYSMVKTDDHWKCRICGVECWQCGVFLVWSRPLPERGMR